MPAVSILVSCVFGLAICSNAVDSKRLMVILMDGFRWDYFNIHGDGLRGFPKLFKSGTKAEHTVLDFPTWSYPNYYTIMTGLYDESHGMVSNYMYDGQHDEYFLIASNPGYNQSFWWDGGEPLWITATRQGKSAYMYYWPNCQVTIRGLKPRYCAPYERLNTVKEVRAAIDDGLSAFESGAADLVGIYFEILDSVGHRYGPRSAEIRQAVRDVDEGIFQLLVELEQRHLEEEVDLIIFSDHGMTEVSPERVVQIDNYINVMDDVERLLEGGSLLCIWPKEEQLDKVYNELKDSHQHFVVYKRQETPEHWHYRKSDRIAPIILSAERGWSILKPNTTYNVYDGSVQMAGNHGYDNNIPDMWGIFVASGPSFKSAYVSKPIHAVDMYQLMCKSMGIQPLPHNGTWSHVVDMLHSSDATIRMCSHWLILCVIQCGFFMTNL